MLIPKPNGPAENGAVLRIQGTNPDRSNGSRTEPETVANSVLDTADRATNDMVS